MQKTNDEIKDEKIHQFQALQNKEAQEIVFAYVARMLAESSRATNLENII